MFQGFTEKMPDFFWQIRFNNERAWFQAHKDEFQTEVQQPLRALTDELFDWFQEKYPELHINAHISRIYRDARRLFGRGPLKDELWVSFQSNSEWNNVPCLYFEISAECWGYGMGCWTGEAGFSQRFRHAINRDPKKLESLLKKLNAQTEFQLAGQRYAKSKGHDGEAIAEWYNMRNWSIRAEHPYDAAALSPALLERVKAGFAFLMPYYLYLNQIYHAAD